VDAEHGCQVSVLPSAAVGESSQPSAVLRSAMPAADLLEDLKAKRIRPRDLVAFGRQIAGCLLPEGEVRDLFRAARERAGYDGGVRLRLVIGAPELRAWPWEYAYLDRPGVTQAGLDGFLALDPRISFVRHDPLPLAHTQIQPAAGGLQEVRMLAATAQPDGYLPLRVDREIDLLRQALENFAVDGLQLKLDAPMLHATPWQLEANLRAAASIYLFHFSGHGMIGEGARDLINHGGRIQAGLLLLEADAQTHAEARLEAADLARWLLRAGVRLAFLNACQSGERQAEYPWAGVAGALVAQGVPAVVAMQQPVEDSAAVAFSQAFYGALFGGLSLDEALSVGRLAVVRPLDHPCFAEWGVPVLYTRLKDGRLFPEREAAPALTGQLFRKTVELQVAMIERGGCLVGVDVERLASGVKISARLQNVEGSATLADIRKVEVDAALNINAAIEKIGPGAKVIGLKTDVL
jgi:hypothetical protein